MESIDKTFYTIGEVAGMIGEAPSLIRFWETEFRSLNPAKSEGGTRKYTQKDVDLLILIHHLVKGKGMTLEGARQYLKSSKEPDREGAVLSKLKEIKRFLEGLKKELES